jgi:hypothetical protein
MLSAPRLPFQSSAHPIEFELTPIRFVILKTLVLLAAGWTDSKAIQHRQISNPLQNRIKHHWPQQVSLIRSKFIELSRGSTSSPPRPTLPLFTYQIQ